MDNLIAESSDVMVNSMNFGLPETAQYITGRRLVNYFPSGSNVYAPNAGNKNLRFLISGSDNKFLDLSSVRLFATLQNTDATRKKLFTTTWRITCILFKIQMYDWWATMSRYYRVCTPL